MGRMRNRGQSILEYVIVLTVIIAAIAYGATNYLKPGIEQSFQNINKTIVGASEKLP